MNFIMNIITSLYNRLVRAEKRTVATILGSYHAAIEELEVHAEEKIAEAAEMALRMELLEEAHLEALEEKTKALKTAAKLHEIFG